MKAFKVSGTFKLGRVMQHFNKEVASDSPETAKETVISTFGSKHRLKRRQIAIESISILPPDQIEDPEVAYRVKGSNK